MRKLSAVVLFGLVIAAVYFGGMSSAQQLETVTLPEELTGDWAVSSYKACGDEYCYYSDCAFVGAVSGGSSIGSANGVTSSIELQGYDATGSGVAYFLVETPEDTEEMGGGGPRKAIGRITAGGQLEIVEARSADADYPADFSDLTKSDSISWSFSKNAS